jgi:aerobic-type carbon monoxide dehydrogenase small subunit (CoxS/CutS family)
VMIDGAPARSCITLAVACDGADIRTVESFDDDPVMAQLRAAFTAEHALQCGFCTPGMLATAHDIVTRLPDADEGAHPPRAQRQSLPLHRLCRHRQGDHPRAGGAALGGCFACKQQGKNRRPVVG